MPFRIYQNDMRVDDKNYLTLAQAALAMRQAPAGSEVMEIDADGKIVRRYSADECEKVAQDFLSLKSAM